MNKYINKYRCRSVRTAATGTKDDWHSRYLVMKPTCLFTTWPPDTLMPTQLTHWPTRHQAGVGSLSPGSEKGQHGTGKVGVAKMFSGETDPRFHTNIFICDLLNTLAIIDLIKTVLFRIPLEALTPTQLTRRPIRYQAGSGSIKTVLFRSTFMSKL